MRAFLDTSVWVYATGAEHPLREPSRALLGLVRGRRLHAEISSEVVQEFLHHRARRSRDRPRALEETRRLVRIAVVHRSGPEDVPAALDLYGRHPRLGARDALIAAVALGRGLRVIVTADTGSRGSMGCNGWG